MEMQRTSPVGSGDSYPWLLQNIKPSNAALRLKVKAEVCLTSGVLVLDDTVLDKPYACKIDPVHHIWSGKHHVVVKGIDLLTLLWTDGERHLLCGYRIYDKPNDGKTIKDQECCSCGQVTTSVRREPKSHKNEQRTCGR